MPVVPEKRQLEDHVHAAVGAQFWGQGVEDSRCLVDQACTSPCEPQPLRLTAPSGLSRAQFLVATRAVRLPIFPGYCSEHGGTVVDRVLLQSGSKTWWAALVGRGKMQRAWNQHTTLSIRNNLADPDNYALAATGRLQLSESTVLRATLQSDSLSALQPLLPQQKLSWNWGSSNALHQQHQQQQQSSSQASGATAAAAAADAPARPRRQQQQPQQQSRMVRLVQGNSLKLQLKQNLQGLDLTADLAMNEMSVDGVTRYAVTPLRIALDVAPSRSSTKRLKPREGSSSSSSSGGGSSSSSAAGSSGSSDAAAGSSGSSWLQGVLFRVGVHGVVAPAEGASTAAAGSTGTARGTASGSTSNQQQREHGVCLHAQGALALTGSRTLWEATDRPWEAAAAERRRHHKQQQRQKQARLQQAELAIQPLQVPDNDNSSSSSSSSTGGLTKQQSPTPAPTPKDSSSSSSPAGGTSSTSKQQQKRATGSSGSRHSSSSSRGGGGKPRVLSFQGQEFKLPLLNPGSVQESVQETSSSIERLRTDLRSWTARVEAGELQDIGKKEPTAGILSRAPGSCWSSFIPGPHFKVSGLIGVLGRVPLHQQTDMLPTSNSSRRQQQQQPSHSGSAASLAAVAQPPEAEPAAAAGEQLRLRPEGGRPPGERARNVLSASATHLDRLVLGSARKLGRSITQESLLRLFCSAGASLQVGEMRSNFLDFTRVEAVLDMGLNGPEALGHTPQNSAGARVRTRATATQGKGTKGSSSGSKGTVRSASPARGMGTILGPAAAAAHAAAAAAQPPLPPPGSSDGSTRSSTIGSAPGGGPAASSSTAAVQLQPGVSTAAGLPPLAPVAAASASTAAGAAGGVGGGAGRRKHPAFALDERGVWHSLTLSATQQLYGPVRLRADARLALDSVHPCPRGSGFFQPSAPRQLLQHIVGVRPALVDAAYGVDVVVPGAGGLVRLVGWYSPGRGEGGLGLRLM